MRSNIEELERQRASLMEQAAIKSKHGRDGVLRIELLAVKQKLSAVTVDTPHEEINETLQREATLTLRLSRGEAELARVENEIHYAQQIAHSEAMRADSERRERQRRRDSVLAQIADIDDLLAGRKPIKADYGPGGRDYQGNMALARHNLEQLRERVMQEAGLTEADISPRRPANHTTQLRPDGRGWT